MVKRPLYNLLDRRPAPDVERHGPRRTHRLLEGVHPRFEDRRHQPSLFKRRVQLSLDPGRVGQVSVGREPSESALLCCPGRHEVGDGLVG